MKSKFFLIVFATTSLVSCTTTGGPNKTYLRVEEYYQGWNFVGVGFTPGADVAMSVFNAPIPCGTSFCASNAWQPIGVIKAGPVGGSWPTVQGQFLKVIQRDEMAARRGVVVTCYPGESWDIPHMARDTVTGKFALHGGGTTAGYFGGLPRCR